jgi:hypothetical protein
MFGGTLLMMDPYAVTSHRFAAFVRSTGYVTEAEFMFRGWRSGSSVTQG